MPAQGQSGAQAAERRPGYAPPTNRRRALKGNAVKQIFSVFLGYLQRKQLVSLPCKRKQCYYTAIQRQNLLHSVA